MVIVIISIKFLNDEKLIACDLASFENKFPKCEKMGNFQQISAITHPKSQNYRI